MCRSVSAVAELCLWTYTIPSVIIRLQVYKCPTQLNQNVSLELLAEMPLSGRSCKYYRDSIFTARAYARAVLGVAILSVRPSHDCIVTKLNDTLQIFLYYTKGQSFCYSDTKSGWWATPTSLWNLRSKWPTPFEKRRHRHISAYNVSTVRDSEKSSITMKIKSTTGFPTSYTWSAYVSP